MKKIITAKHFFLYKTIQAEIFNQLLGLEQEFPHLTSTRIVLHHQKGTFSGEMVVNGRKIHIISKAKGRNLLSVIYEMIQKTEIQIRKRKDKTNHTKRKGISELEQHMLDIV